MNEQLLQHAELGDKQETQAPEEQEREEERERDRKRNKERERGKERAKERGLEKVLDCSTGQQVYRARHSTDPKS